MQTRREFLATSALAAACAGCGTFGVGATRGKIVLPDALKSWKEGDLKGSDVRLYHNAHAKGCHEMDFTDAVYEGRQPACPVEVGHRSATICHLANIAARLGRTSLKWDPKAERAVGDAEANARLAVKHCNGWTV